MIRRFVALAALVALTLAPDARAEEEVGDSVRSVLHDPRYRFCHEDDYPLLPDEHAWCPLVGDVSASCPALPRACKLAPVVSRRFGRGRGAGAGKDQGEWTPQADSRQRPEPEWRISLPDMSGFAQVLFYGLLAVGVVVVARAIARNLLRDRGDEKASGEAPPAPPPPGAPPPARGPVETDVERLLARAHAAAQRGDFARAVDDAYAALLRRLDGDGLIEIHPSRTNGDYVRNLRDRPDLRGAVRSIARDVERVQFGATAPSEPAFRSVLERVLPLVSRALGLVMVFAGLSVALSCTPHGGEDDERSDTSPSGTQALVEVLGKQGLHARHRTEALSKLDRPLSLVLLPGVQLDDAAWKHLFDWVRDKGGRLVLAGVTPLPAEIGHRIVADDLEGTKLTVGREASNKRALDERTLALPPGRRLVQVGDETNPDEVVLLLRQSSIVATERTLGEGRIVVVADDRLFTNIALTVSDDASLMLVELGRWAGALDVEIEICDAWTGAGAQTPFESMQHARLTPVIVQLFALLALLFLWKGVAFARLRDPPAETRRAFADHARALGLAYGRSRASRHVAGLYAVWALERLRERVHRSGRQGLIPLAEAIAVRTGRSEGDVMSVLAEAASARAEAAPPSSFRPQSRRDPGGRARPGKDAADTDLTLMRELMSFLTATGQGPKGPTTPRGR